MIKDRYTSEETAYRSAGRREKEYFGGDPDLGWVMGITSTICLFPFCILIGPIVLLIVALVIAAIFLMLYFVRRNQAKKARARRRSIPEVERPRVTRAPAPSRRPVAEETRPIPRPAPSRRPVTEETRPIPRSVPPRRPTEPPRDARPYTPPKKSSSEFFKTPDDL